MSQICGCHSAHTEVHEGANQHKRSQFFPGLIYSYERLEIEALEPPECLTIFLLGYFPDIADAEDKPTSLTLAFQRRVPPRLRFTPGATLEMFLLHAYRKQQVTMKEVVNQKLRPPWPRRAMEYGNDSAMCNAGLPY